MTENAGLTERLARLDPEQRAAATAPPGPILCIAPAGSGKTSTLVARIAWLLAGGVDAGRVTAVTFNRRAAEELAERLAAALRGSGPAAEPAGAAELQSAAEPAGPAASSSIPVRVRTFHALGLEILRDAGKPTGPLLDRDEVLREILPEFSASQRRRLDLIISRLKLDLRVDAAKVAADPEAGPSARAYVAYEQALQQAEGLDFDDLVARAVLVLETDQDVLARWRARCDHLLVDEAQDLDRMQLRMALLLAAPANRIFLVGDDDQSIYGWRLADVRRLLGLAATSLPDLRRHDLATNYRCPGIVVERAVRLVSHNTERFAKTIRARRLAIGTLILAPSLPEPDPIETCTSLIRSWPDDDATRAVLARTNRELIPAVAACLALDVPFRAAGIELPVDSPHIDTLIAIARRLDRRAPLLTRLAQARQESGPAAEEVAGSLLAWAPAHETLESLESAIATLRAHLARLRRDDAPLTLATAHGTKGLEFDHVAVIGLDDGRFPSARSITEAEDPLRALEEERRLAYVAWTRARRSLTLSYDPAAPSRFLHEAFDPEELAAAG
ncbi:MAG: ATP-dependent helicase [Chloroflexota bacterium]